MAETLRSDNYFMLMLELTDLRTNVHCKNPMFKIENKIDHIKSYINIIREKKH